LLDLPLQLAILILELFKSLWLALWRARRLHVQI
jgi:hypothetical protein